MHAEVQLDAVAAQDLGDGLAERPRLAREDVVHALDERDLAAEARDGLGHLDADRPAAEDEQAARDLLHPGRLAVGPQAVELAQAGDRREHRIRAGGQHDMLGGVARPVDLDDAGPGEPTGAAQDVDALTLRPALRTGVVVAADHEVAPGQRRGDIDRAGHRLGGAGRLARRPQRLTGTEQGLGRDARPVVALAAQPLALDDGHPQAAAGERGRAVLARRPRAHHDDVVVGHAFAFAFAWSMCHAAMMSPMCEKAWGKFPSSSPFRVSISSAISPRSLA